MVAGKFSSKIVLGSKGRPCWRVAVRLPYVLVARVCDLTWRRAFPRFEPLVEDFFHLYKSDGIGCTARRCAFFVSGLSAALYVGVERPILQSAEHEGTLLREVAVFESYYCLLLSGVVVLAWLVLSGCYKCDTSRTLSPAQARPACA